MGGLWASVPEAMNRLLFVAMQTNCVCKTWIGLKRLLLIIKMEKLWHNIS